MPYIPEEHKKYLKDGLLSHCRRLKTEFIYRPSCLMEFIDYELSKYRVNSIPHEYTSYEQYYSFLDYLIENYSNKIPNFSNDVLQLKKLIEDGNHKEEWSICRFIGKEEDYIIPALTTGKAYYWPTSKKNPVYHGVVENDEFDTYPHSTRRKDWEILEDPTGMAKRILESKDNTGKEYYNSEQCLYIHIDYDDEENFELVDFDVKYNGKNDGIFKTNTIYHVSKIITRGYEKGCYYIELGEDEFGDDCFYVTDLEDFIKV